MKKGMETEAGKETGEKAEDYLRMLLEDLLRSEDVEYDESLLQNLKSFISSEQGIKPDLLSKEDIALWYKYEKDTVSNKDLEEHARYANSLTNNSQKETSLALHQLIRNRNMLFVRHAGNWTENEKD
ncbi:MAG: hypothetical protein QMD77_00535 [Patescibacteria group bacterium]|nr:hypothetical protein [Patescibacteria group bacterium]